MRNNYIYFIYISEDVTYRNLLIFILFPKGKGIRVFSGGKIEQKYMEKQCLLICHKYVTYCLYESRLTARN